MKVDTAKAQAESRLSAMRKGKRHVEPGKLEVNGEQCAFVWQVLTRGEKQECLSRAIARFADLGIPAELRAYQDLEDEVTVQVVAQAMRDPDDPERALAKDADELRSLLSVDQLDALWTAYADVEDTVNPDLDVSPYIAAIEAAVKKKDQRILMSFGTRLLASYLLTTGNPLSS